MVVIESMKRLDDTKAAKLLQKMARLLLCVYCIKNKNSTQSVLRDISRCCKEVPLPSKTLLRHGMCCSAASLQLSVHFT